MTVEQTGANHSESTGIAILAGGGSLPVEAAHAARAAGHRVLMIALADEADLDPLDDSFTKERVAWGQFGTLFKLLDTYGASRLVIVGSITKRPEFGDVKLDWGAVQLLPKLTAILFGGGDTVLLDRLAKLFSDRGVVLAGVHEIAPDLVAGVGHLAGPKPSSALMEDAEKAAHAAWTAGAIDLGQGAIAAGGRLIAMEGAEGTDGLLERTAHMRSAKRFSIQGKVGAIAKCPRPDQDLRLDMPAIGPKTVVGATRAGLHAIVVEAGKVLVSLKGETMEACVEHGVSLIGLQRADFVPPGRTDKLQ
ncbi:MAG: UDP-2,3-diacylglucosamine diphosphatase LpxI [Pseudomonadota bacterium]